MHSLSYRKGRRRGAELDQRRAFVDGEPHGMYWSRSDVQQGVDAALAFACPGESVSTLSLRYERISFTPIVLVVAEGRDEPCGLIKLSCRLQESPDDGTETVEIHDKGPAQEREPVDDVVWGEVLSAYMLRLSNSVVFPPDLFGRGIVIPPDSVLFANCRDEEGQCLRGLHDLPAKTCAWSGLLLGYLERFQHGLAEGKLTRESYQRIRKDPVSLAAFGLMTITDAVNLKDDRRYDHNLFQRDSHFLPLDMEGLNLSKPHIYNAGETAKHPLFLHGSDLEPSDVGEIFDEALAISIQMCGSATGPCRWLLPQLARQLAMDPFLEALSSSPERVDLPVLCPLPAGEPLLRRFGPCCPARPWGERKLCLGLQVDLPHEITALGETIPVMLTRLVALRLRAVRDALATMRA